MDMELKLSIKKIEKLYSIRRGHYISDRRNIREKYVFLDRL